MNNNKNLIRDIEQLKEALEHAKTEKARAEGALDQFYKELKADFDIQSIEDAEKMLAKWGKERDKINAQIQKKYKEIKEKYEW